MNPFRLTTRRLRGQAWAPGPSAPPANFAGGFASPPWPRGDAPPGPGSGPAACAVPWRVTRGGASGVIELENAGEETLLSVRFALAGAGLLGLSLPSQVAPGERLRVVLRGSLAEGAAAGPEAMLVVRWFRSDGMELLWPIAL